MSGSELIWIILSALLPVIAVASIFYFLDKNKEPVKSLIRAFFVGILSIGVTALLYRIFPASGLDDDGSFINSFMLAFYNAAFHEELAKYIVFVVWIYRHKEFDEWYDGILYGVMIGLGFGFIENLSYFFHLYAVQGLDIIIQRNVHSMPMHALLGGMMGFYLGKTKFNKPKASAVKLHLLALFIPMGIHGAFNFVLAFGGINIAFISIWIVAFSWYKVMKLKKISQEKAVN